MRNQSTHLGPYLTTTLKRSLWSYHRRQSLFSVGKRSRAHLKQLQWSEIEERSSLMTNFHFFSQKIPYDPGPIYHWHIEQSCFIDSSTRSSSQEYRSGTSIGAIKSASRPSTRSRSLLTIALRAFKSSLKRWRDSLVWSSSTNNVCFCLMKRCLLTARVKIEHGQRLTRASRYKISLSTSRPKRSSVLSVRRMV